MSHRITGECLLCGACQAECPAGAVGDVGGRFVVDAARCTDCGSCAEACPVGACVPA